MAFNVWDFEIGDRVQVSKTATVIGVHISNKAGGGEDTLTIEDETGYRNTVYQHAEVEKLAQPWPEAGALFLLPACDAIIRQSLGDGGYRLISDEGRWLRIGSDRVIFTRFSVTEHVARAQAIGALLKALDELRKLGIATADTIEFSDTDGDLSGRAYAKQSCPALWYHIYEVGDV